MSRIGLTGLMKLELPTRDVLLCDGGFIRWGADTYTSTDEVFGPIGMVETPNVGEADTVPKAAISFLPPGSSEPGDLSQPAFQSAPVRFWVAEYDVQTSEVVGVPVLEFYGQLDQPKISVGHQTRTVDMTIVSLAERLFTRNRGNSLNPAWHRSVWPDELGHDNATGLTRPVAWGTTAPANASAPATRQNGYSWGGGREISY